MSTTVSSIRISATAKAMIERAARKLGMSYNEFITVSASERAAALLNESEPLVSNIDRILAIADHLDFHDDTPTAESTIRNPFPGLADRDALNRELI